jgi:feruloyl esterase
MKKAAGWLTAIVLCTAPAAAQTGSLDPTGCAALATLQLPGLSITEVAADWIAAGPAPAPGPFAAPPPVSLPAHCRVRGTLNRRVGSDGRSYGIGFALALPQAWTGRLLFQGGSGFNGFVGIPMGAEAAGETPALARGFAVVTTDSGHQSANPFDQSFAGEQQAVLDFAYQAIERVTSTAKAIVARLYGQPARRSYFAGCSTGGREAMTAAQRNPLEFDGVISGAPAMRANYSALATEWATVQLNTVAPRNADGRPDARLALSPAQKQAVIEALRTACDGGDGVRDGLVFGTSGCTFDPKRLACSSNPGPGCLTDAQAVALDRAFSGPQTSAGRHLYAPFPFDTGVADTQGIPGLLNGTLVQSGATSMNVDAAARTADADGPASLTNTAQWTNMTTFVSRGGKMLLYHGVSDPTFSALDTVDYYQRLGAANGGADAVQRWSRLFLVPGMGHCRGGSLTTDSFDLLTALVDWVERGVAPDAVVATRAAPPRLARPLCAYPRYAHYSGRGDPNDASSFECRAP